MGNIAQARKVNLTPADRASNACRLVSVQAMTLLSRVRGSIKRHNDSRAKVVYCFGAKFGLLFNLAARGCREACGHCVRPQEVAQTSVTWLLSLGREAATGELSNSSDAVQYFKAAVLVDPTHAASWHAWGMLERQEGNAVKARDIWIKVSNRMRPLLRKCAGQ